MKNTNKKARFLLIISRILAYGFVIFLCFLCLFCFLLLILMASKSNSQMQGAFNFRWGGHFMENLYTRWRIPGKLAQKITIQGMPLMLNEMLWSSGMAIMNQCYSTRGLDAVAAIARKQQGQEGRH